MTAHLLFRVLFNLTQVLVPVIVLPHITRSIGVEEYGNVSYWIGIAWYFVVMGDFGSYSYGLRKNSEIRSGNVLKEIFKIRLFFNFLSFALFAILFFNGSYYAQLASIGILATFLNYEWVLESDKKFNILFYKSLVLRIIYIVLVFHLIASSSDAYLYLLLTNGYLVVSNLVGLLLSWPEYKNMKFVEEYSEPLQMKKLIKNCFPIFIHLFLMLSFLNLDRVLIGTFSSATNTGLFSLAEKIFVVSSVVICSINQSFFPFVRKKLFDQSANIIEILKNNVIVLVALLGPSVIGLLILGKTIVIVIGGSDFAEATTFFPGFGVYIVFFVCFDFIRSQLLFANKKDYLLIILIGFSLLFKALLLIIFYFFGVLTNHLILYSTSLTFVFLVVSSIFVIDKKFNAILDVFVEPKFLKLLTVIILFGFGLYGVKKYFDINSAVKLLFIIKASIVVYGGIVASFLFRVKKPS